jgi:hypothetical protein
MHMSALLRSFGLFCIAWASLLHAQPMVDIRLVESTPGILEVRLRPDGDFNGVLSALCVTIRWEQMEGGYLGQPEQMSYGAPNCAYYTAPVIMNVEGEVDNNGYRYYTNNAFGFAPISAPCVWTANTEVPFFRIPVDSVEGCAHFEIVNDGYTLSANKDFYLSLNGLDRTGAIYGQGPIEFGNCGKAIAEEGLEATQVFPNPATHEVNIRTPVTAPFAWSIADATGRSVRFGNSTTGSAQLDVRDLPEGLFLLEIVQGRSVQRRFVVAR